MRYLDRFSPIRAYRDLRFFLSHRQPYELGFFVLAMMVTSLVVAGFVRDSNIPKPYKKNIIYVKQWPLTRTNAEIVAQQKIDNVVRAKERAEIERQQKDLQAQWKRLDDKLKAVGL